VRKRGDMHEWRGHMVAKQSKANFGSHLHLFTSLFHLSTPVCNCGTSIVYRNNMYGISAPWLRFTGTPHESVRNQQVLIPAGPDCTILAGTADKTHCDPCTVVDDDGVDNMPMQSRCADHVTAVYKAAIHMLIKAGESEEVGPHLLDFQKRRRSFCRNSTCIEAMKRRIWRP
jgi:hypothetical protein